MTLLEKVAYLKGLVEATSFEEHKKEKKIVKTIVDLLSDLAYAVSDLEDSVESLSDELEAVNEDLGELEDDYYDLENDELEDDDDSCLFEVTCPTCDEKVCIDDEILSEGSIDCPNCGELLEFDYSDIKGCDCKDGECLPEYDFDELDNDDDDDDFDEDLTF